MAAAAGYNLDGAGARGDDLEAEALDLRLEEAVERMRASEARQFEFDARLGALAARVEGLSRLADQIIAALQRQGALSSDRRV